MGAMASQIEAPCHWPLRGDFPHNGPVTRKMFPFDDVIIKYAYPVHCGDIYITSNDSGQISYRKFARLYVTRYAIEIISVQ